MRLGARTSLCAATLLVAALLTRSEAALAEHKLPLLDGIYLNAEVPCGEAYMAAMLQIMGDRLEAGRALCTIKSVSRQGTSYVVAEECQQTDTGRTSPGKLTLAIPNDHTIVLGGKGQSTRFRHCPIASLPDSFSGVQEMVPLTPPFEADP